MSTPAVLWIAVLFLLSPRLLQAQIWRPIASIPSNGCCSYDSSRSYPILTLGPTGIPYLLYQDYVNPYANSVIVTAYDGSAWVPVGNPEFAPSYMGYADIHVGRNNTVYAGLNGGGPQPDAWVYSGSAWIQKGPLADSTANTTTTPVSISNDATGKPWYAIYNSLTGSPGVYTFNSGAWVEIGAHTLGNGAGGAFVQMAFDYQNTPYIAYDENNSAGPASLLVVEKYSGGAWTRVGTSTLYSTGASHILTFDDQNTPYVIDNDPTNGNSFKLMKFTGTDWAPDGPVVAATSSVQVSANHLTQLYLAMGQHNTPLICYWSTNYDPGVFGYPVAFVKLDSSAWVPAADTTLAFEATGSNVIAFAADTLGHAFLATTYFNAINPDINAFELFQSKPKPVITFNSIDTVYGTADFPPGATSTNTDPGDPITYTIADTTIATIVNGKIHILKAGNTTITATQAADSNWLAGGPVQAQLNILVATQTISFPGWPQKKVGDPDFPGGATASSGLPLSYESSDPTIATVDSAGTIHIIEQGAVIVTVNQWGNNNYLAAPAVAQVLIITDSTTADSTGGSSGRGKGKIIAYCNSRSSLLVQVIPPVDGPALLEVYNSFGWRIYSREIDPSVKGGNTFLVPVGELPGGIYYVRVKGNGYNLIQSIWIK